MVTDTWGPVAGWALIGLYGPGHGPVWARPARTRVAQGGRPRDSVWALSGSVHVVLFHGGPRGVGL